MCYAIVMLPYLDVYVRVTDLVVFFAKMEGIDEDGDVLHAILHEAMDRLDELHAVSAFFGRLNLTDTPCLESLAV